MKSQRKIEVLIYTLIWLMVFIIPIFSDNNLDGKDWNFIFSEWIRYTPLLIIFIINDLWLSKKYLLKRKYLKYVISIVILLITFSSVFVFTRHINQAIVPVREELMPPMNHSRADMMPDENLNNQRGSDLSFDGNPPLPPDIRKMHSPLRNILESIILSFLVIGFNDALKLAFRFNKDEVSRQKSEKIYLETQLSFLRTQISPHFFMNTLNNIHALIDIEPERAQKAIIKLSNLMRYLLKQSEDGQNTIKEEFNFLMAYIDLMSLRYSDKVKINTDFILDYPDVKIPSLLFISVVENAFKYGVSYEKESFIDIMALQDTHNLKFISINSKTSNSNNKNTLSRTGVGLSNLKKQLDLLFPEKYTLKIEDKEDTYKITIIIPVNYDKVYSNR